MLVNEKEIKKLDDKTFSRLFNKEYKRFIFSLEWLAKRLKFLDPDTLLNDDFDDITLNLNVLADNVEIMLWAIKENQYRFNKILFDDSKNKNENE